MRLRARGSAGSAESDTAYRGVVVAFRSLKDGSNQLRRLVNLPRHDELLERGTLGGLVTRRIIDQYVGDDLDQIRTRQMQRWLEALG